MYTHNGRKTIFTKQYTEEELADLERDISEAVDSRYNSKAEVIQEDGFNGTLIVKIIYKTSDCCDC